MLISAVKNNTAQNKLGVGGYFIKISDVGDEISIQRKQPEQRKTLRVEHANGILGKAQSVAGARWSRETDEAREVLGQKVGQIY